jgi:hypothetical protein
VWGKKDLVTWCKTVHPHPTASGLSARASCISSRTASSPRRVRRRASGESSLPVMVLAPWRLRERLGGVRRASATTLRAWGEQARLRRPPPASLVVRGLRRDSPELTVTWLKAGSRPANYDQPPG